MDEKEERLVRAVAALQAYCDDPSNPLSGPELGKLLNEFFAAADDIRKGAGDCHLLGGRLKLFSRP